MCEKDKRSTIMTRERTARNISNSIITLLREHPYFMVMMLKGNSTTLKRLEDDMHKIVQREFTKYFQSKVE